jgi:hypothetical protein
VITFQNSTFPIQHSPFPISRSEEGLKGQVGDMPINCPSGGQQRGFFREFLERMGMMKLLLGHVGHHREMGPLFDAGTPHPGPLPRGEGGRHQRNGWQQEFPRRQDITGTPRGRLLSR